MDEDVIADLKQFIAATVSQAVADLATKGDLDKLEKKMDRRFDELQTAIPKP